MPVNGPSVVSSALLLHLQLCQEWCLQRTKHIQTQKKIQGKLTQTCAKIEAHRLLDQMFISQIETELSVHVKIQEKSIES